ncbi:MAG: glucose-6-phosphate dehydrogenase [candidate division Zixibacteria bacterium]|nr:glucose-6-phosphate dehydrogenase [candidate division Zixibacteria bacterium]
MTQDGITSQVATSEIPGGPILAEPTADPCVLVIFGITGDLAKRKLIPALYNLMVGGSLPRRFAVMGLGRTEMSTPELRERLREQTGKFSRQPLDSEIWNRFAAHLEYVCGSFDEPATYEELRARLSQVDATVGTAGNRIYYLSTPAATFPVILENLHANDLLPRGHGHQTQPWAQVIIEKPFGRDLDSARELNRMVRRYIAEDQTYRIDHYLGKETVQNILVFRFGNSIFEPFWNRKYIDYVEITAAETIGLQGRGRFYDQTGVIRDVVQNHLLQVLALCAVEPPVSFTANDIRDQKVQVLKSLRPITSMEIADQVVTGQYRGYCDEPGVAKDSRTPTYVAMKVLIDNWRWQGVPFYLRAGKNLGGRCTEVAIHFQPIPLSLFPQGNTCQILERNILTLRIQPEEGISLRFVAKVPGEHLSVGNVSMNMNYSSAFGKPLSEAYERLLLDCMRGDATLFERRDGVEQAWQFVTPILDALEADTKSPVNYYAPGSAGPAEADQLLARDGRHWSPLS